MDRLAKLKRMTKKPLAAMGWDPKLSRWELGCRTNFSMYRHRHSPETLIALQIWFPKDPRFVLSGLDFWFHEWCGAADRTWASNALQKDESEPSDEEFARAVDVLLNEWLTPFVASLSSVDDLERWMMSTPGSDVAAIVARRQPDLFDHLRAWQNRPPEASANQP